MSRSRDTLAYWRREIWIRQLGQDVVLRTWGAAMFAVPGATLLTLLALRTSRRAVKARPMHLVRVAAYGGDGLLTFRFLLYSNRAQIWSSGVPGAWRFGRSEEQAILVLAVISLWMLVRVGVGIRLYLGLRQAPAITVAIGVMAAVMVAGAVWEMYVVRWW